MTTLAPASASASTQASPIACPPPVTTATRPSRRSFSRYMVDPSSQLLDMPGQRQLPASAAQGRARLVEAMNAVGPRRQPDMVARLDAELARRPGGDRPDLLGVDMEEGVGPEMLGNAHRAAPLAGVARDVDMLGPDADRRRAVRAALGLDQVHLGRADESRDEEVGWS